jgi:hypothetical protein
VLNQVGKMKMGEFHYLASKQPEIPGTVLMKGMVKLAGLDAKGEIDQWNI